MNTLFSAQNVLFLSVLCIFIVAFGLLFIAYRHTKKANKIDSKIKKTEKTIYYPEQEFKSKRS